jgi:hypothetical protein
MTETGVGWPEADDRGAYSRKYSEHANVKLSPEQKEAIARSGQPESEYIREAVQMRLDREGVYACPECLNATTDDE